MDLNSLRDLYPAPFPNNVPIADIQKLSLKKLLDDDPIETQKMFDILSGVGFFYLDMMDHEKGRKLWEDACTAARSGMEVFPHTPLAEKRDYKAPKGVKVLDRGYQVGAVNEDGTPRDSEMFMIPQHEMLGFGKSDWTLPGWLAKHEERFQNALRSGNVIANVVLGVLEKKLQLAPGTFTSLHRLTDSSGDFLRVIRYPGSKDVSRVDPLRFPPHKDAVSVAILFTWLGGLQMIAPDAPVGLNQFMIPDEHWRWIKPLPGTALINLGEAMEIFTNGVLKAGMHRIVKAPGDQIYHDKYSVLLVARPEANTPMKAFESPMIPPPTADQAKAPVYNSFEWGNRRIQQLQDFIDGLQTRRAGKEAKLERSW
ncbi:oxidoreductase [Cercophora scortea]|uniref:Oxidoreductase n=1 Tax=Cercophora scortea TaxID=314031 RepID=A0AAE0IGI7_9PEZI|nr:oxidoreductase [Cercophora scortea]